MELSNRLYWKRHFITGRDRRARNKKAEYEAWHSWFKPLMIRIVKKKVKE